MLHRITDAGHVVWVYQETRLFPILHFDTPCTKRNVENKRITCGSVYCNGHFRIFCFFA